MPNNQVIYWGIVVLVATVLLWIGAELTKRIERALPYAGGIGVVMAVGGFIYEFWKARSAKNSGSKKIPTRKFRTFRPPTPETSGATHSGRGKIFNLPVRFGFTAPLTTGSIAAHERDANHVRFRVTR